MMSWFIKSEGIKSFSLLLITLIVCCTPTVFGSNTLCKDDDSFRVWNNKEWSNCSWVAKKSKKRCNFFSKNNGIYAYYKCKKTCGLCSTNFKPPTKSPTIAPVSNSNPSGGNYPSYPSGTSGSDPFSQKKSLGEKCVQDSDCSSNVCRNGTCYASSKCKAIKQLPGQTFDTEAAVLVFVGSGFTNSAAWNAQVKETYSVFKNFEFFEDENDRFVAFYVDELESSFCNYGCGGIDRLLCCDTSKARALSNECFPSGATLQTIVVHNDSKYGGAGYRSLNMATTSSHSDGPMVAVHELGHSMFELGDEYTYGGGTSSSANCDVAGCPKWNDLGYGHCVPGYCNGGKYYVSERSFMNSLSSPIGKGNLRFSCCAYLALTNGIPSYCNQFGQNNLIEYCKKDYQKFGFKGLKSGSTKTLDTQSAMSRNRSGVDESNDGKLSYVKNPLHLTIDYVQSADANADDTVVFTNVSYYKSPSSLFRSPTIYGDFPDYESALSSGLSKFIRVKISLSSGREIKLTFGAHDHVVIPPLPPPSPSTSIESKPNNLRHLKGSNNSSVDVSGVTKEVMVEAMEQQRNLMIQQSMLEVVVEDVIVDEIANVSLDVISLDQF